MFYGYVLLLGSFVAHAVYIALQLAGVIWMSPRWNAWVAFLMSLLLVAGVVFRIHQRRGAAMRRMLERCD